MSASSQKRSAEYIKLSAQFKLGALITESSHPITANLSDVARQDITAALKFGARGVGVELDPELCRR